LQGLGNWELGPGGKGDGLLDLIINDLKPYVDKNFRTKPERNFTGIAGLSLGGLFSVYAGVKRQDVFSKVLAFSGSFWFGSYIAESNQTIFKYVNYTNIEYEDMRFFFLVGALEVGVFNQVEYNMPKDMRNLVKIMRDRGYNNIYDEVISDGTHEIWHWRREFPKAYDYLYL
jgi:predicted alpha/beta superfamily hydrolase